MFFKKKKIKKIHDFIFKYLVTRGA